MEAWLSCAEYITAGFQVGFYLAWLSYASAASTRATMTTLLFLLCSLEERQCEYVDRSRGIPPLGCSIDIALDYRLPRNGYLNKEKEEEQTDIFGRKD